MGQSALQSAEFLHLPDLLVELPDLHQIALTSLALCEVRAERGGSLVIHVIVGERRQAVAHPEVELMFQERDAFAQLIFGGLHAQNPLPPDGRLAASTSSAVLAAPLQP